MLNTHKMLGLHSYVYFKARHYAMAHADLVGTQLRVSATFVGNGMPCTVWTVEPGNRAL